MSTLKVEVVRVDDVQPHPNADRLEIATVKGWQCVVGKGDFEKGGQAFYFPIDSVLPDVALSFLFANSKIKPPSRIKTIKIRGAISQGLLSRCCPVDEKRQIYAYDFKVGDDVTERLGVTKYEPPASALPNGYGVKNPQRKAAENPHFQKYTDLEHLKNHPNVFSEGELVVMHEKIHGTNFRAGWVPMQVDTFWKKVKKFIGLLPEWEFVYGSRNVQLQSKKQYGGYYADNVYAKIVEQYKLDEKLGAGEVLYGEIYGDGIQKGYTYGCKPGEQRLAAFDLQVDGKYVDYGAFYVKMHYLAIPMAPLVGSGTFRKEEAMKLAKGESVLSPSEPIREGIVIRPIHEQTCYLGRKILKLVSDEYLLRDNSDFH